MNSTGSSSTCACGRASRRTSNCSTTAPAGSRSPKRGPRTLRLRAIAARRSLSPNLPAITNAEAKKLADRIRELEAKTPRPGRAPTMRDGNGINEHVFIRGNHKTLGVEAPRGTLEAFGHPPFAGTGSGRLELAKTVTDPGNPLVARVIVNRLWKHHFGEGIVHSPDNFGHQGQPPTHPELLDWLASELVQRKMVAQADAPADGALDRVPPGEPRDTRASREGRHGRSAEQAPPPAERPAARSRGDPRRILAVSGRLDRKLGGPGVLPHLTEHQVGRGRPASGPLDGNGRRSIYLQVRRNFLNPMFTAFDYPTPFTCIGRRTVSNVPAQALVMLNNPFVLQQAELWAKRVLAVPHRPTADRVRDMYLTAFGRLPSKDELPAAIAFVAVQVKEYGNPDHTRAWTDLAHVLFNAKEFIFVE